MVTAMRDSATASWRRTDLADDPAGRANVLKARTSGRADS